MAENEVKLMKGNEVIAHAAIRYGCDGYFGYPITPQSEVMETLMELKPWETTGMVVLQAESEISSINMVSVSYTHLNERTEEQKLQNRPQTRHKKEELSR